MSLPLKILLLEDSPTDAEIIQRLLRKEGLDCVFHVEMNRNGFLEALEKFSPDIILSDNSMPQFNALEALQITRAKYYHIPFILITGTVSEEYAATILKEGADDYLLKDRLTRLPSSIETSLKKRQALKELTDYKYALDQSAIVAITDQEGIILYANENLCRISRYRQDELIGNDYRIVNSRYHSPSFINYMWATISDGKVWRGEIRNRASDGTLYWVDSMIIPFLNDKGVPYQYLSIQTDITERKRLEYELQEQHRKEQLTITAMTLEAQENERNILGRELHDNVNQILVGTKLLLTHLRSKPQQFESIIDSCIANLQDAINENRRIAHELVAPDFEIENLPDQLDWLTNAMLRESGAEVEIDTKAFKEERLTAKQKLAIYRIAQEQCINIVKYAHAKKVKVYLKTGPAGFEMSISDNGKGTDQKKITQGIGIKNMRARLSIFNGSAAIVTAPEKGFSLQITIPL